MLFWVPVDRGTDSEGVQRLKLGFPGLVSRKRGPAAWRSWSWFSPTGSRLAAAPEWVLWSRGIAEGILGMIWAGRWHLVGWDKFRQEPGIQCPGLYLEL